MIFLTVGTQLPFDRLVQTVDIWAKEHPKIVFFGQIGKSIFKPKNIPHKTELSPLEYDKYINDCELIISHAGIGTILNAIDLKKRIIIFPRRADLNEHRNDHQMATARWLKNRKGIYIAQNSDELFNLLDKYKNLYSPQNISQHASGKLIKTIRSYLLEK